MRKLSKRRSLAIVLALAMLIALTAIILPIITSADPVEPEITAFGVQTKNTLDLAGDESTELRFLFQIGKKDYDEVGFVFSKAVFNPTIGVSDCHKIGTTTVYSTIIADGKQQAAEADHWWVAVKMTNIPHDYFDGPIYVRAFVTDGEGTRYSDPVQTNVCSAKLHTHTVTGVYETVPATLLSQEKHVGTCSVCGLSNVTEYVGSKKTGIVANSTSASAPDGLGSGTNFYLGKYKYSEIRGGNHFYPTEDNLSGNDLLIEYSVLWNSTMKKSNGSSGILDVGRFTRSGGGTRKGLEMACRDNLGSQWCKYAGGFEGYGVIGNNGSNDVAIEYGPVGYDKADKELFPNIGEYGWHRLGVRVHEDAFYDTSTIVYRITVSLYIDGEKVLQYVAKSWDPDNDDKLDLLLYKAELVDGHLEYSDNDKVSDKNNYAYAVYFNNFYNHANTMYLVVDDVFVTCGREFVQQVKPVEDPAAGPTLTLGDVQYDARFFYEEGHSPDMYTYRSSQKYADGTTSDSNDKYILSVDKMTYKTLRGDKNFYDDGNDVLVEFSMLWDERFTYGNTSSGVLGMGKVWNAQQQHQRKGMEMAFWNLLGSQDCQYAGGFEGYGVEKPYTYGPSSEGGTRDFAYVGDYGWHRIGVRMHESYVIEDDDPVYTMTMTLYVDGVQVLQYNAFSNADENNGDNWEDYDLLFYTVVNEGGDWTPKNHDTDGAGNALTISPVEIAGYFDETGVNARFFTVADVYATVGSDFVMKVNPVANPAPRTESVGNLEVPASYYFTEVIPHSHEWDGEYAPVVKATLTDVGTRTEHCTICGEAHGIEMGEGRSTVDVKEWLTSEENSQYRDRYNMIEDVQENGTKHFYPTASHPEGNDLLIEYSVLWNETLNNLSVDTDFNPYVTSLIGNADGENNNNLVWWSLRDGVSDSWCQFGGGFEATFATDTSDGSKYTPVGMTDGDGVKEYADYPNIGGSDPDHPEYGWHRIGIRVHQEVTNLGSVNSSGSNAIYKVTITTYFDGVAVSRLYNENKAGQGDPKQMIKANLLYTVVKSDGKYIYSDMDTDRYVFAYRVSETTKAGAGNAYWAVADAYVTCGTDFVQSVKRVDTPEPRTETLSDYSVNLPGAYYYTLQNASAEKVDGTIFNKNSSGQYRDSLNIVNDVLDGDHFFPTAGNPDGNDLLVEYSILWNESLLNLRNDEYKTDKWYTPYLTTDIGTTGYENCNNLIFWSPTNDINSSWCKYAGGFESGQANKIDLDSENGLYTNEHYPYMATDPKKTDHVFTYADYPNIGGTDSDHPEWGWHRLAIRVHQEVLTYGANPTYKVTVTTYIDGNVISELYRDGTATQMFYEGGTSNLLYTVSDTNNGGVYYNGHYYKDIAADKDVFMYRLNSQKAISGKEVHFVVADVSATCGQNFVMNVKRSDAPVDSIYSLETLNTKSFGLPNEMYFVVVD